MENHGYTYTNSRGLCSTHSSIYKIFLDSNLVYEKPCTYLSFYSVIALSFINDSTGFLIEGGSGNIAVYKTKDFGKSWRYLGSGGPILLGYYVVNEHDVYLITTAKGWGAILAKASDINGKGTYDYYREINIIENEANIKDTIYGNIFCDIDALSFKVKEGVDTISYRIEFQNEVLPTISKYLFESQFTIYPNPCINYVYFSQNILKNKGAEFNLYALDGRLVRSSIINETRLYVGDLKSGIYLMEIQIGDIKTNRKIIKQ